MLCCGPPAWKVSAGSHPDGRAAVIPYGPLSLRSNLLTVHDVHGGPPCTASTRVTTLGCRPVVRCRTAARSVALDEGATRRMGPSGRRLLLTWLVGAVVFLMHTSAGPTCCH